FTEHGEVIVRVERDPEDAAAGALRFAVCDTGIGIPEETRELIFAPYAQVDTSTTRKFGGSGLGLAISREVVELMQGRIWAESSIGAGSTFYFTARFAVGSRPPLRVPYWLMDLKGLDDHPDAHFGQPRRGFRPKPRPRGGGVPGETGEARRAPGGDPAGPRGRGRSGGARSAWRRAGRRARAADPPGRGFPG